MRIRVIYQGLTPLLPEEGWQPLRLTGWWEPTGLLGKC